MNAAVGFNYLMHLDSRIDATTPPSTVGVGGKWGRAHVLLECACPVSQGGTFRASLQAEFLDRAVVPFGSHDLPLHHSTCSDFVIQAL